MVSIKISITQFNYLIPFLQIDWIQDKYDININTKALSILGLPISDFSNNQNLNIIGKKAVNLKLGCNIEKNKWIFRTSFSQHVPYKIDVKEKIIAEEKEKEELYGGGLFQVSISKYLD